MKISSYVVISNVQTNVINIFFNKNIVSENWTNAVQGKCGKVKDLVCKSDDL